MPLQIQRAALAPFIEGMREPRQFLQVVAGPRQVGKTTQVQQALKVLSASSGGAMAQHSVSADSPGLQGTSWLAAQWETARALSARAGSCILVLDEVQKLPGKKAAARWTTCCPRSKRCWHWRSRADASVATSRGSMRSVRSIRRRGR